MVLPIDLYSKERQETNKKLILLICVKIMSSSNQNQGARYEELFYKDTSNMISQQHAIVLDEKEIQDGSMVQFALGTNYHSIAKMSTAKMMLKWTYPKFIDLVGSDKDIIQNYRDPTVYDYLYELQEKKVLFCLDIGGNPIQKISPLDLVILLPQLEVKESSGTLRTGKTYAVQLPLLPIPLFALTFHTPYLSTSYRIPLPTSRLTSSDRLLPTRYFHKLLWSGSTQQRDYWSQALTKIVLQYLTIDSSSTISILITYVLFARIPQQLTTQHPKLRQFIRRMFELDSVVVPVIKIDLKKFIHGLLFRLHFLFWDKSKCHIRTDIALDYAEIVVSNAYLPLHSGGDFIWRDIPG